MANARTVDIQHLIALAREQGWEVIEHRTKREFRPPNGMRPVFVTSVAGHADEGTHRANLVGLLRRSGLVLDDHPKQQQEQPDMSNTNGATPAPPMGGVTASAAEEAADAIGTLLQMVEELADQFTQYRKHSQDEAMKLRRDIEANKARVSALEETVSKQADAVRAAHAANARLHQERDDAMVELRALVAAAAREAAKPKADPLEAFRKRLA